MNSEPAPSAWLALPDGGECQLGAGTHAIGRAVTNRVVIPDHKVSRTHAIIHFQNYGDYMLVDLGSANGTHVNGRRISSPTCLKHGDRIKLGDTDCVFKQGQHASTKQGGSEVAEMPTLKELTVSKRWFLIADIEGGTGRLLNEPIPEISMQWGQWFAACKSLVEEHGGCVNAFLGDGFLATWIDSDPGVVEQLTSLLTLLEASQARANPAFRLVLHYGTVHCGTAPGGAESLLGPQLNFAFRMEKLAGRLDIQRMASKEAAERIATGIELIQVDEEHALTGFTGTFAFFRF
jgi:class 3 adenylate cyclase